MPVGIRIHDLRKVYNTPPPMLMGAAGFSFVPTRTRGKSDKKAKKFEVIALNGITLDIAPGEILGLLGPNGAGKSTTVGILTTRVRPTGGNSWIGDHDVWKEQAIVKCLIGVVPQRPNHDFSLTAREILIFHAAYFGIPPKEGSK